MAEIKQRVFLDTNVLVDVLIGKTRPSHGASLKLFQAARAGMFEAFITTQSIIDAEFISNRSPGSENPNFYNKMLYIMSFVNVTHIDGLSIREALKNPTGDFEDDAQFIQADSEDVDVVVTSDHRFLARQDDSGPLFITPEGFIEKMS
jgi:predicted nucleic acid-binding protein